MASEMVKVACIQCGTPSLNRKDNIKLLQPLIEKAAKNNASFVLLPEFATIHYEWFSRIWQSGEIFDINKSETLSFLQDTAKKYKIYLATTFLEVEGTHFYNCFVLFDDNGNLIGKVRKNTPPGLESFYYKGSNDSHIIKTTKYGNIAVAICLENHLSKIENEIMYLLKEKNEKISFLLSPHCVMTAIPDPKIGVTKELADNINNNCDTICIDLSKKYNLNVIFANKIGSFESCAPIGDYIMKTNYCGLTKIIKTGGIIDKEYKALDKDFSDHNGEIVIGDIDISNVDQIYNDNYGGYISTMYGSLCQTNDENKKYQSIQKFIGWIYYNCSIKRRLSAVKIYDGSVVPYLLKTFVNMTTVYIAYKFYIRNKV